MADATAGIGEVLPCFGNELPFVGACFERELQDAEGSGVAYFTVGLHLAEGAMTLATRADHKFTDAPSRIGGAVGRLRSETLVVVIVTVDNHVGVGIGESLPERLHRQVIAMRAAGTEKRLVAVSERAGGGMRGQIRAQPFFLRRTEFAATNVLAFAVQDNDVPGAEFVAVIAGLWIAGGGAKIRILRYSPRRIVSHGYRCQARFAMGTAVANAEVTLRHGDSCLPISHAGGTSGSPQPRWAYRIRAGP